MKLTHETASQLETLRLYEIALKGMTRDCEIDASSEAHAALFAIVVRAIRSEVQTKELERIRNARAA